MSVSYTQMVESFGHEVLAFETTGRYQGDHWALLKAEDGRLGFMNFGYGSCSGCDHLEGLFDGYGAERDAYWEETENGTWFDRELSPLGVEKWDEFCKGYEDAIRWFDTAEALIDWMTDRDGMQLQWFWGDDEFKQEVLPKFISLAVV